MNQELKDILKQSISVEEKLLVSKIIKIKQLFYFELRDAIWKVGRIVSEIEEKQIYIAAIKINGNTAYLAIKVCLEKLEIIGYAKEGLFHQHTVEKSVDLLEKVLSETQNGNKQVGKMRNLIQKIFVGSIFSLFLIVIGVHFLLVKPAVEATVKYNQAVKSFNEMSVGYDEALSKVNVENIVGISGKSGELKTENESYIWSVQTILKGNNASKIIQDTATIYQLIESMKNDVKVATQLENPSSEWVVKKLQEVSQITDTAIIVEENDFNKMLGKEGGYTSCVYFAVKGIASDKVQGDSIIERGTDGGAAVEVFKTVEEAQERIDYLAGFDNTLLYSGSYALVGTMVIRTSYLLDGPSQIDLTNEIVQSFTK